LWGKKVAILVTFLDFRGMIAFLKKYFTALYIPITWTVLLWVLLCLPGSMLPNETGFKIPNLDKIVHMGLFGGFVFLWSLFLSKRTGSARRLLWGFFIFYVIANFSGVASELIQRCCIPGRDYDLADIIADMTGAGLAYALSNLFLQPPQGERDR
jgi:VanZ family protein